MKHVPNTDVPCAQCSGTGRKPTHMCGACDGTGLSTAPWDQRRKGTTITVWNDDPPKDLTGVTVEHSTYTEQKLSSGRIRKGYILLISWEQKRETGCANG